MYAYLRSIGFFALAHYAMREGRDERRATTTFFLSANSGGKIFLRHHPEAVNHSHIRGIFAKGLKPHSLFFAHITLEFNRKSCKMFYLLFINQLAGAPSRTADFIININSFLIVHNSNYHRHLFVDSPSCKCARRGM